MFLAAIVFICVPNFFYNMLISALEFDPSSKKINILERRDDMITRLLSAIVVVVRSFFKDLFGFVFLLNLRPKSQSSYKID